MHKNWIFIKNLNMFCDRQKPIIFQILFFVVNEKEKKIVHTNTEMLQKKKWRIFV